MLPSYDFYRIRKDNKHMTEPWLDQALIVNGLGIQRSDVSMLRFQSCKDVVTIAAVLHWTKS